VTVHWKLPDKYKNWWIVFVSACLLITLSPASFVILLFLTLLFHYAAGTKDSISSKRLIFLIFSSASILSFYKFRASVFSTGIDLDPSVETFLIPLGLSYYSFRCIHYAIEKYKHTIPAHNFQEFATYMFFLPTFFSGPIHRFHAFQQDMHRKRWNSTQFASGVERMLIGYFKIAFIGDLLLGNYLGLYIMNIDSASYEAYMKMIKASLTLYVKFSGYSDIAIGLGMLLGFKVMENFNYPFLAKNITDFWRRWHISLTSWCRDYVYMGTMAVSRSAALSSLAAMLVMGLWHEFSIRFILWGVYQGTGIIIWQKFQNIKSRLPQVSNQFLLFSLQFFSTLLTLHYVMFGVLIAHHSSLSYAMKQWELILLFWL
jgi:alginate O-acetyltransferase complex protein AlgI